MKRTNKNSPPKFVALLAGAALLGLVTQSALAVGTASGTSITNLATLSYTVGGVTQTPIGSSATGNTTGAGTATAFVVDNKVNVTVVEGNATFTTVVPGQLAAVTTFTVTNAGNTAQDFALTAADVVAAQTLFGLADNFVTTNIKVFVDANANGTYEAATDTATFIDELPANGTKTVFVVVDIPVAQINNDAALVSLTAITHDAGAAGLGALTVDLLAANTAGVDVVFADALGTDDIARDGKHSARDAYKVVSAIISVAKTVTLLCDPFNGGKNVANPKNIPGAAVQYAITITNSGMASATLSQVTDALNAALGFDTTLISGAGVGANCATGAQSLSASGFGAVAGVGATTSYVAPGLATQAVTAGASVAGAVGAQTVTINFPTLVSPATGALVGGVLPAGDFVTVYFNAFVQ